MFSQGSAVEFGKNRVQYHDFEWWQYESENFITLWYGNGQKIAQSTVQIAELDYEEIRSILEYRINDKIKILIYNDLTDLKQSNIGHDEVFMNTSGTTQISGNKIFIYFDGNHTNLRKQIREGIAQVLLNNMMFGVNLQEIVQNAVLMNLPAWFTDGLVKFVGEDMLEQNGWTTELDNRLRDLILSEEVQSFDDLMTKDPTFAGHTFWYFISQNYGKSTVSNLLYLTRINKSVESGFLYVLGNNYNNTMISWKRFYENRYKKDKTQRNTFNEENIIAYKNRKNIPITQLKISPNGKYVAYVQNEIGKYKVVIQDIATGERQIIKKDGSRNQFQSTDYNYPLLAWTKSSQNLAVAFEKRDVLKLMDYDIQTKKSEIEDFPTRYERVLSMDFYDNRQMVVAAIEQGYSDIFLFDIKSRGSKKITNDFHDDLSPIFVNIDGRKGIVFSSNRSDSLLIKQKLDTILPITNFDLWYFDLDTKGLNELVRITNTPLANETQPIAINERYFGFLSNQSGITNRQIGYMDTVFAFNERVYLLKGSDKEIILAADSTLEISAENIDTTFIRSIYKPKGFSFANTNYDRSILKQSIAPRLGKVLELVRKDNQYLFFLDNLDVEMKASVEQTVFMVKAEKAYNNAANQQKESEKQRQEKREELDKQRKPIFENPFQTKPKEEVEVVKETVETKIDTIPATEIVVATNPPKDTGKIDIDNYFFQSDFDEVEARAKPVEVVVDVDPEKTVIKPKLPEITKLEKASKIHKFKRSRITPYELKFRSNFVTSNLDNSLLFDGRIPYSPENPYYEFPTPGLLMMGNIDDLFEDYIIQGGIRIPTTFNGAEYFLMVSDLSKRLDKRYTFYRRSIRDNVLLSIPNSTAVIEANLKTVTNLAEVQFKYPLDIFTSLRGTATFRTDDRFYLVDNQLTIEQEPTKEQRLGAKVEYVFDNTMDIQMNIKNGTRYKFYAEAQKRFSVQLDNADGLQTDFQGGWLGLLGVDARHYQRLDKRSILAFRFSSATSFGDDKILYFLGGTDNTLIPFSGSEKRFERSIPIDNSTSYAYKAIATNLRGFASNIRNGSSFAVANTELRIPFFQYFKKTPIKSAFLRNFQIVGFFDIGTAWEGLSPFNDENPLNTVTIDNPATPITVKVNYFRNPIVSGFGYGVRSTLFGYYVRLDIARGLETGVVQDRRFYLSLGTDF
jgi:Tol biopolymer transport system component